MQPLLSNHLDETVRPFQGGYIVNYSCTKNKLGRLRWGKNNTRLLCNEKVGRSFNGVKYRVAQFYI